MEQDLGKMKTCNLLNVMDNLRDNILHEMGHTKKNEKMLNDVLEMENILTRRESQ